VSRILIVEDEAHLAAGLRLNLELEGHDVEVAETLRQAASALVGDPPDLILLDVMLPDGSGVDFCAKLRKSGIFSPVLMLTALGDPEHKVAGLDAGADDYLPKPFELQELLARVRSLLRRTQWGRPKARKNLLTFGDAVIDFDRQHAEVAGRELKLTSLEFKLLAYFAAHANRVLSRDELLREVWGMSASTNTRTTDNFVSRLRRHFETDPRRPRHFLSVHGAGYRFRP